VDIISKIRSIREIEEKINRNLFFICGVVTVVIMAMYLIEFFSRGRFSPADMSLFYLGILVIYSFHKELIRWLGKRKAERRGEYFVYGWIALTTALYLVNFFSMSYFDIGADGTRLTTLRELSMISVEVLAIFIMTRSLKILKLQLEKRKGKSILS